MTQTIEMLKSVVKILPQPTVGPMTAKSIINQARVLQKLLLTKSRVILPREGKISSHMRCVLTHIF